MALGMVSGCDLFAETSIEPSSLAMSGLVSLGDTRLTSSEA